MIPILRHFCLFAAMGVFMLYVFVTTFFVGCLALDEKRIDNRKVCACPCIPPRSRSWEPNKFSQRDYGRLFFDKVYTKALFHPYMKVSSRIR